MKPARSLWELADARVDADWLCEAAALTQCVAEDGAAAALRLRVFRRAESALAAARVAETAAVVEHAERATQAADRPAFADLEVAVALNLGEGSARMHAERARLMTERRPRRCCGCATGASPNTTPSGSPSWPSTTAEPTCSNGASPRSGPGSTRRAPALRRYPSCCACRGG